MLLLLVVPVAKVVLDEDCVLLLLVAPVVTKIVLVTVGKVGLPVFGMAVEEPGAWTGIE